MWCCQPQIYARALITRSSRLTGWRSADSANWHLGEAARDRGAGSIQSHESKSDRDDTMTDSPFLAHLEELRKRLLRCIAAVVVTAGASFYFADRIVAFVVAPLQGTPLYVTEVTGSFNAYLMIALFTGILLALPFLFYQLWSFIAPGLYPSERRYVIPIVLIATSLFLAGAAFCYFIILPFSLKFLIDFSGGLFSPIITVSSYITFAGIMILSFGLGFELPVATYFLGRLGIVTSSMLASGRRVAVVVILIAAAILTPTPDVFTQLLLAIPLYLLYEASIIIVRLTGRREPERAVARQGVE